MSFYRQRCLPSTLFLCFLHFLRAPLRSPRITTEKIRRRKITVVRHTIQNKNKSCSDDLKCEGKRHDGVGVRQTRAVSAFWASCRILSSLSLCLWPCMKNLKEFDVQSYFYCWAATIARLFVFIPINVFYHQKTWWKRRKKN